ncbi:PREDICTED: uncharacterized protein LOC109582794 isoform X2 [Amphimedon queenslandica]|uniref:Uncharacterized protein n=1 Tax=Amphimedon queenslandica TaxID=400682 RepID=A0AAN0J990_AMPQE|nr:PREDICTED: uncharacterized protein LOC109582794 isoform X2 [Amphimedon queenslandica]|eukprot:XP_019853312.1 PREDICTED: uncharacterized protein LOC109582794 isoform X2 [Amphimedon queenslandica]
MADDIQQLQPTMALTASEPDPASSTLVVTTIRSPGISIQGEGPRSSHATNGATPSLVNGSSSISRSPSTSIHGQAQQEENAALHRETTPLLRVDLTGFRGWRSDKLKIRKLLVILSMIAAYVVVISLIFFGCIYGTIKPISHSLSKVSPTSVEVLNPLPGTDSLVELLTVNGWNIKDYLMWVKSDDGEDYNVLKVYEIEERKTNWSNATYESTLTNQPLPFYYALAGSEVVFKIFSIEDEENGDSEITGKISVTFQLLDQNEASFCKQTYEVEVNESLDIIKTCRIPQNGYYSVSYIGSSTKAITNMTYNTLLFDVNGLKPSCLFNQYSNCSQYVSLGKKPILVLKFNLSLSTFNVNFSFTPRKELYWFVVVPIVIASIAAGILALLCYCLYSRFVHPRIDKTFE